ncbi:MAG: hypothetical protein O3A46_05425 [Candidatus Poribacteria bacterium]|nr:hypothetical protein [Candidatus Poribacteria bacterium]
MRTHPISLPTARITVDAGAVQGPLETWRHALGHGGINALPLPERVVEGTRKLRPRWIRIFLQEFFNIYPERGRFDWSRLDPYMESFAATGANVVAAITIKPKPLFPEIDHAVWRPNDIGEWQEVIRHLVRRYSVEKKIVTHWEIGNEPDIGEDGGSPYIFRNAKEYGDYYAMTVRPILEAFPGAKVGGPAMASMSAPIFTEFIKTVRQTGVPCDFLSWHLYHSDPGRHGYQTSIARLLAKELGGNVPELYVTEWNRRLSDMTITADDQAYDSRRAATVAAAILSMRNAGLSGSFYYHLWDQVCYPEDFQPFFSERGVANMLRHWNDLPHRLGLFGVEGEVRPQYFVYRMLSELGENRLSASCDVGDVGVLSGCEGDTVSAMFVNHSIEESCDRSVAFHARGLRPGRKTLTVTRIDDDRRWSPETCELLPVERREVVTTEAFECRVHLPADSVALLRLEPCPRNI